MECGKRCLLPLKFGTATNKMGLQEEHAWVDHSEIQSIRTENAEKCTTTKKKWIEIRGSVCGRTERNVLNEMEKKTSANT